MTTAAPNPPATAERVVRAREQLLQLNALLTTIRDSIDVEDDWRLWHVLDQANTMCEEINLGLEEGES